MDKKGSATWIIVVGIMVFAILIVITIIIANTGEDEPETEEYLNVYVNSVDSVTGEQLDSNYLLKDSEGITYKQGKLDKTSLIQIKDIPKGKEIILYCWGGNHYFNKTEHNFTDIEKFSNSSKITCNQNLAGDLEITHTGNINEINNQITFKIKSDYFRDLSAVFIWSSGIINVNFEEQRTDCIEWINSSYNLKLVENNYLCENKVYLCEKIDEPFCTLEQETPQRFIEQTDKSIYMGKDINGEEYEFTINVKTEEIKNENDYLGIIFYDKDLVYLGERWSLLSEYNNENLGGGDFEYRINYTS